MIELDPAAALELIDARDYYENARSGLGRLFELAAHRTLDAIDDNPERYPPHRFARTPGIRHVNLLRPPRFPYAIAYLVRPGKAPYVLAFEQFQRAPMYWRDRLQALRPYP